GQSGRQRVRPRRDRPGHESVRRCGVPQGAGHRTTLSRRAGGTCHGADHRRAAGLRRPGVARFASARRGGRAMTLLLGAVAYDPKVVTIWTGFREWFLRHDFPFDYVLYSHYERQVDELLAGHIHVAWNSPLAWVRARRLASAQGVEVSAS